MVQKCPLFVNFHTIENVNTGGWVVKKSQNLVNVICERPPTDNSNFNKRCSDAHFVSFLYYYYCTKGEKYCIFLVLRKVKKIVFPRNLKVNTSIHKTEVQNWCTKLPNQSSDWRRVHNTAGGTRGREGRAPPPTQSDFG